MVFFAAGEFSVPILLASGLVRVVDQTVAQSSILPSVPQFNVNATTVLPVAHALATELPTHVAASIDVFWCAPIFQPHIYFSSKYCANIYV